METLVKTLAELDAEAARFVGGLAPKEDSATLVALSGDLGAGKTAFIKAVAHALGVAETVTSPTFVLEKIYQLGSSASKFKRLIHIDAYRLESGSDLAPLGFDELMKSSENLIFLEWPEKVADTLVPPAATISIVLENGSRLITYA